MLNKPGVSNCHGRAYVAMMLMYNLNDPGKSTGRFLFLINGNILTLSCAAQDKSANFLCAFLNKLLSNVETLMSCL